jgi:hypothetical protein
MKIYSQCEHCSNASPCKIITQICRPPHLEHALPTNWTGVVMQWRRPEVSVHNVAWLVVEAGNPVAEFGRIRKRSRKKDLAAAEFSPPE